jgi:hypothetical protein
MNKEVKQGQESKRFSGKLLRESNKKKKTGRPMIKKLLITLLATSSLFWFRVLKAILLNKPQKNPAIFS